jgi:hypothetical protein
MSEPSKGYVGVLRGGKRNGSGVQAYPDGSSFAGVWVNDRKHGDGKYNLKNGDSFTGTWRDHKVHGTVRYTFSCGDSLSGEYAFGKPYGQVTVFLKKSGVTRVFPWSNLNAASVHSCARTARDLAMAFTGMVFGIYFIFFAKYSVISACAVRRRARFSSSKQFKGSKVFRGLDVFLKIKIINNDITLTCRPLDSCIGRKNRS